jgi:hypothetical protein
MMDIATCVDGNPGACQATILARPPIINPGVFANLANQTMNDWTWLLWDNFNSVVLYPFIPNTSLLCNSDGLAGCMTMAIYHPTTDTWETDPMLQPQGLTVRGNSFAFDKINNYLLAFGGVGPNGNTDNGLVQNAFIYRYAGGASPLVGNLLQVNSVNPSSGVAITVSPNDINGNGNGSTAFTRFYISSDTVTLVAPSTASSNAFAQWVGCDTLSGTGNRTCTVSMSNAKSVSAEYSTGATSNVLSVTATVAVSVSYTVSGGTCSSSSPGTTNFTRTCDTGTQVVLTAPTSSSGGNFSNWTGCNSVASNVCTVGVTADKTVMANYGGSAWPAAPDGLSAICSPDNSQITLSWSPLSGASTYAVRLNYLPNDNGPGCQFGGWYCSDPPDSFTNNNVPTSYTANITRSASYSWWVHGSNGGNLGAAASGSFSCGSSVVAKFSSGTFKVPAGKTLTLGTQ